MKPPTRPVIAGASTYLAASLLCTQLPLLREIGYEYSAVTALLGSIIAGMLSISMIRPIYRGSDPAAQGFPERIGTIFRRSVAVNLLLLVIPLGVSLANIPFARNCAVAEGLGFFLLLPVVSILFSSSLGLFCTVHYRHPRSVFFLVLFATLAYALWLGYSTPAVFSYNFFYGYFPGITYDEALGLTWTLVWFRLATLSLGGIVMWLALLILRNSVPSDNVRTKGFNLVRAMVQPRRRLITGLAAGALALIYAFRCSLGFESTAGYIEASLGSVFRTEHFAIYYAAQSYSDEEIRRVAAEHEFRLQQVMGAFNLPAAERISSFIYPSDEIKRTLTGAGATEFAKPWSRQIHISKPSLEDALKHELVHVGAAAFGEPIIRANLSTGLVEGLAVAIAWDGGTRTPHQYAAALEAMGLAPEVDEIMSFRGFASRQPAISYVIAGSFCRFLIDRYGIGRMTRLYRGGHYEGLYGRSLRQLGIEWRRYLDRYRISRGDTEAVDTFFRSPPIFRKVCAHVLGARALAARHLLARKEYAQAEALYTDSYREGKETAALGGMLFSALRLGRYSVVTAAFDSVIVPDPRPARFLPLYVLIGDALWATGRIQQARDLYLRVREADLSDALTERAVLRGYALREGPGREKFMAYFLSDVEDSLRLSMLDSPGTGGHTQWLSTYLRGTILFRMGRYAESLESLRTLDLGTVDSLLEKSRLTMVGSALFRLGAFQEAKISYWSSLNYVRTEAATYRVVDAIDRCDWMTDHALP